MPSRSTIEKWVVCVDSSGTRVNDRDAAVHREKDGDLVRVRFTGERALVLENVLVRVGGSSALELHLDTDDANAADVRPGTTVEILR